MASGSQRLYQDDGVVFRITVICTQGDDYLYYRYNDLFITF
jgi:hypothetical protein